MTSKLTRQTKDAGKLEIFPDFPPRDDMQNSLHLDDQGHQGILRQHLGDSSTTIVLSEIPVRRIPSQQEGHRIPDLLVAFGVDRALATEQKGYSIRDQGKPPDFVLEIGSATTGREEYIGKRNDYAAFGIQGIPGGSTPRAGDITTPAWLATGWWQGHTSPFRLKRWARVTTTGTATRSTWTHAGITGN